MSETSPQQQNGPGLINWTTALDATGGDEELLLELVKVFIDEGPASMLEIRQALDQRNAVLLRRSAHTLKGSLRLFECKEAFEHAWQIEEIGAKKPDPPDVEPQTGEDWKRADEIYDVLKMDMQPILQAMKERADS